MGRLLHKFSLRVLIIVLISMNGNKACLEKERLSLLEIKAFLKSNCEQEDDLVSWVDVRKADCCEWERVKGNATSRRVTQLYLNYTTGRKNDVHTTGGKYEIHGKVCRLNHSLLHSFEELISLDLSKNRFDGWIEHEGYGGLGTLKKLEILNLGSNFFNISILPSLSVLVSLKTLILSDNNMEGALATQGFGRLSSLEKLEVLDLSYNYLNSGIFSSLGALKSLRTLILSRNINMGSFFPNQGYAGFERLSSLKKLDLSFNWLNSSILSSVGALTSPKTLILSDNSMAGFFPRQELGNMKNLEMLDLSFNQFNGSLPMQGFCELKGLLELDLSYNEFSGHLPQCLSNFTNLQVLDLSSNALSGNIPSAISELRSLEYLSLSENKFEGLFLFSTLANHSKLEAFQLSSGGSMLQVETENIVWLPTFQLKAISISKCNLNAQTGSIPSFLLHQYNLRFIDLSHNKLNGKFPFWLLKNNLKLEVMNLVNNSFTGPLQVSTFKHDHLRELEISSNKFIGQLPKNIGVVFPELVYIQMSKNSFEGTVSSSISELKQLRFLDLSRNNFSGELPESLFMDCGNLRILILSYNNFRGNIIPERMNLTHLERLHLNNNNFTRKIGDQLLNSRNLYILDTSNNNLSDGVPNWIGNLSSLMVLLMSENLLQGGIPSQLCNLKRLEILNLSQNKLSSSMPSCMNFSRFQFLYLQGNGLSGLIPEAISRSSILVAVDLRDNKFSGRIPSWINKLLELRFLLLGGNQLQGHIPDQLCQLRNVSIIELSGNVLHGPVPSCFSNISFGMAGEENGLRITYDGWWNFRIVNRYFYYNSTIGLFQFSGSLQISDDKVEVEFMMKNRYNSYKGAILDFMTGLDLSCNKLSGNIPPELGNLHGIRALNLSHNYLSGSIPASFSSLKKLESLDLCNNSLSGEIPTQLTELYSLSIFNVSYNNLSGRTPEKGQFGTFDETNYLGNPSLCGSLIERSCSKSEAPPFPLSSEVEEDEAAIYLESFYWSFFASYAIFLLGLVAILCINRHWRKAWFDFVDECICSCFIRPFRFVFN